MQRLRVLVLATEFPSSLQPHRASFNRQHLLALSKFADVHVVSPVSWRDLPPRIGSMVSVSFPYATPDSFTVEYGKYWYPPGVLRSTYDIFLQASVRTLIESAIASFHPDVLLGIWAFPQGVVAQRIAEAYKLPCAIQVLGTDINYLHRYPARERKLIKYLNRSAVVLTVSNALGDILAGYQVPRSKIRTVYRGVDDVLFSRQSVREARQQLGLENSAKHLIFVGNLVEVKGPDVLLKALARLRVDEPIKLHFLGAGGMKDELRTLAEKLGIDSEVFFHDVIPHRELPGWFNAADLLVLPSRAEGVPNVLLEARAIGCPYVASKVGGVPEISEHYGAVLVDPESPGALAHGIERALTLDRNSVNPQDWPSWNDAGAQLHSVLQDVVNKNRMQTNCRTNVTAL